MFCSSLVQISQFYSGLTRAILDTFPTVKFTSQEPERARATPSKDIEAHPEPGVIMSTRAVHLNTEYTEAVSEPSSSSPNENGSRPAESSPPADGPVDEPEPSSSLQPPNAEAIPDAIGRETCPICIVDFEEGDDLRILPCDGAHCFHQSCVDPWLLELSTACPICRQDFIALENMISGGSEDPDSNRRSSRLRRFSRYLRFARHRHEQDAGENNAVSG
ncbi:hypothetical protein B0H11DRAFT_2055252 [Mycena galericulata]|nr:hypothetical protein B0H11DRAFT_2055252 [Mycena galericulata]